MREFETQAEVLRWLVVRGFKVSKSKLNRDVGAGNLRTNPDGVFEEKAVRIYAESLRAVGSDAEDAEKVELERRRELAEVKRKEAEADLAARRLAQDKGQFVPVEDFNQLAHDLAVVVRQVFEQFCDNNPTEIIHLVGGDPKLEEPLREYLRDELLDVRLHSMSKKRAWEFEEEEPVESADRSDQVCRQDESFVAG